MRLILFLTILCIGCTLPPANLQQFRLDIETRVQGDSSYIEITNPVRTPLQFFIRKENEIDDWLSFILPASADTQLVFSIYSLNEEQMGNLKYSISFGDPETIWVDTSANYRLPFPTGKKYKVIQGYEGSFSHNSDFSRYAIDFNMEIGDTVTAARDGVVIGIIEGYDIGGNAKKYRPYANYITILHADGVMTQYVHLQKNGALVSLGDSIMAQQPIGISGNTGYTSIPHLHFNVLKPVPKNAISIPVRINGVQGSKLKKGVTYSH